MERRDEMKTFLRTTLAAVCALASLALAAPGAEARVHHHHRHHHAAPAAHHGHGGKVERHAGRHHRHHAAPAETVRHGRHHHHTAPVVAGRRHGHGHAAAHGGGCRTVLVNHHWTKRC